MVERALLKNEGKTRHDLGREDFLKRVWEWKSKYGSRITSQLRKLGTSADWNREFFTMDESLNRAVVEAFNQLHAKGLVYRAQRIGNWCCALKSAISDIEVDYLKLKGRTFLEVRSHAGNPNDPMGRYEFGTLTHFAYPVENSDESIVVATTRLETMLGDTAVAVHPKDPLYLHLHGKYVIHPFQSRRIPIITDAELVDMSFGTGAVKIVRSRLLRLSLVFVVWYLTSAFIQTPAHDPIDYKCGKRHNLEFRTILSGDGTINEEGAPFTGMLRYDARIAVECALKEKVRLLDCDSNLF